MNTVIKGQVPQTVREQILKVRDTGETNMFNRNAVMQIASREGWHELVDYLYDRKNWKAYNQMILTGSTEPDSDKDSCADADTM